MRRRGTDLDPGGRSWLDGEEPQPSIPRRRRSLRKRTPTDCAALTRTVVFITENAQAAVEAESPEEDALLALFELAQTAAGTNGAAEGPPVPPRGGAVTRGGAARGGGRGPRSTSAHTPGVPGHPHGGGRGGLRSRIESHAAAGPGPSAGFAVPPGMLAPAPAGAGPGFPYPGLAMGLPPAMVANLQRLRGRPCARHVYIASLIHAKQHLQQYQQALLVREAQLGHGVHKQAYQQLLEMRGAQLAQLAQLGPLSKAMQAGLAEQLMYGAAAAAGAWSAAGMLPRGGYRAGDPGSLAAGLHDAQAGAFLGKAPPPDAYGPLANGVSPPDAGGQRNGGVSDALMPPPIMPLNGAGGGPPLVHKLMNGAAHLGPNGAMADGGLRVAPRQGLGD